VRERSLFPVLPALLRRPALAAIRPVRFDGLGAGFFGCGFVADGVLEVAQDLEGLPWLGHMPERFVALDGALQFGAGFFVAVQRDERAGEVVADECFALQISKAYSDVGDWR
jgi:hypothetical protein